MPAVFIDHVPVHYEEVGEGFPVLFGHSFLWDKDMWKPQLEALAKHFKCISVDLYDHGKSGHLPGDVTDLYSLSEKYALFMKELGYEEYAICGLSIGGMWGAHLALNHPEHVKALIVMNSDLGLESNSTRARYDIMLEDMRSKKGFSKELLDVVIPIFFTDETMENGSDLPKSLRKSLDSVAEENIEGIERLGNIIFHRKNLLDQLYKLKMPTMIIAGDQDKARPKEESIVMAENAPSARLEIISNAGHISNLEQPDKVTGILLEFLSTNCPLETHLL